MNNEVIDFIAKAVETGIKDATTQMKVKKPKSTKRGVRTRAASVEQMKEEVIHRMYTVMTKHIESAQFASQF